ncbi:XylR family transcriptional regulator [Rubripirellula reticaptiva]|uniref:Xylose operon regulatory protein n=1 Tax=Rubripirellula reticaptiva TaxID=2528013 RepID=A0A5C6EUJ5_9BACT|nr:DNA-binding transcriptional regulator [Rubripirellula reticaptiva]TWU51767.1 Xylose operon regulatory protein [Rubripirellula reticaptiva]
MRRRVALIIETSSIYGRDLLSGIVRFMRMHDDWSVFLEQRDLTKKPPSWIATWKGDGVISRATTPALVAAVQATQVPLVELTDRQDGITLPCIRSDDAAIGRMAADHLLERGFRRFGFCGFRGEAWSHRREKAFAQAVHEAGCSCDIYNSRWYGRSARSWEDEQQHLVSWLKTFARPFGIMTCSDIRGTQVLDACSTAGLSVPEEAAVVGVDNDELLCRICAPPLSSVIPNAEGIGYRAAELLTEMMDSGNATVFDYQLEPLGVATRQSTDVVAIDDPAVAAAVKLIRENACRGITVDEVTANASVSRSTLERQLRKYLGRSPQEEIRFVQVKRVRELLLTTDLSIEKISFLCGFDHPEYLHVVFKRVLGITPGQFRQQVKPTSSVTK